MENSVATFNLWQQVYCLSLQSCLIGSQNTRGTPADLAKWHAGQLANFYAAYKAQMGAGWSTVWGPVVFEADVDAPDGIADNVMYVAANAARSVFVVAIAGTNFASMDYDVAREDNAVARTVQWAEAFPSLSNRKPDGLHPHISSGTRLGVSNLLAMTDGATGETIAQYLASAASKAATLVVAGHSLGGALAPTLAMALFNSHGGQLSKSDWLNVHFYSTAGPTPGNGDFARFVAQQFPPVGPAGEPYQCWNRVVWNSLDAVPQGWVVELLKGLPELYPHVGPDEAHPWPPPLLQADVDDKILKSRTGELTGAGPYVRLANHGLVGQPYDDGGKCKIPVTNLDQWKAQMQYQHMTAYDVLLDVQSVHPSKPAPADRAG